LAVLLSAGCSMLAPQADPTEFFVLKSLAEINAGEAENRGADVGVAVGVGPIELPEYLDRPQLVRRQEGNRLEIEEARRWAERLQSGFARVLAENLRELLGARVLDRYPWSASEKIDYGVRVEVGRFEPTAGGMAELTARWFIREAASRRVLHTREANIKVPITSAGSEGSVRALSEAVADLSRDIAEGIRQLSARASTEG
jgi:uncharacterized lipoprotein YmbA